MPAIDRPAHFVRIHNCTHTRGETTVRVESHTLRCYARSKQGSDPCHNRIDAVNTPGLAAHTSKTNLKVIPQLLHALKIKQLSVNVQSIFSQCFSQFSDAAPPCSENRDRITISSYKPIIFARENHSFEGLLC